MIVILTPRNGEDEEFFADVAAVVIDGDSWIRFCWDGKPEDRTVELSEYKVVVVP